MNWSSRLLNVKRFLNPLLPDPLRRGLRAAQSAWNRRFGPFYCPVCENRLGSFKPLPSFYREQWTRYGFDMEQIKLETLNEAQYSCPLCQASDRDRLYALFLRERLAGAPSAFRRVDFALAAPLRDWINRSFRLDYRTADRFMKDVDD